MMEIRVPLRSDTIVQRQRGPVNLSALFDANYPNSIYRGEILVNILRD